MQCTEIETVCLAFYSEHIQHTAWWSPVLNPGCLYTRKLTTDLTKETTGLVPEHFAFSLYLGATPKGLQDGSQVL